MNRTVFFDRVRAKPFGGSLSQLQVDGLSRLLDEAARLGMTDRGQLAYILATSYHETGQRMQPVREAFAKSDAAAVAALDKAWKEGRLGSVSTPYWRVDADGKSWFGRGDVQLTHKDNYKRMGDILGIDLVGNPGLALDPAVSARILFEGMLDGASNRGDFTGKNLEDFVSGSKRDFVGARAVVNGKDRAADITSHATKFLAALDAAGWDIEPSVPVESPEPVTLSAEDMVRGMATALETMAGAAGIAFKWEISK